MTYANQFEYDNATEPELSDYREEQHYLDWLDMVTKRIISGDDSYGIDPWGALAAYDAYYYVQDCIDDEHYFTYIEDQQDYDLEYSAWT